MTAYTKRKIIFLTGTRADFGKLKALMLQLDADQLFDVHVFVTGMHMLSKYGYTCTEVEAINLKNIYKYINQSSNDSMDQILAKTIYGLSDYVKEVSPDMIVVHGDRVEALAGASVGALNNVLVGHVEGGEVSGTVDEIIRHAVTKLSNIHFVANDSAKIRISQLGEVNENIHVIGSPDIDVMNSKNLPELDEVKKRYSFDYDEYAILMFHPVTTELKILKSQIRTLVDSLIKSNRKYIVIYPNNDHGTDIILDEYTRINENSNFRIYPSMRFEYFLTLLKNAQFIIGNSSAGVREAPHFGVPAINLGSRQKNRVKCDLVIDIEISPDKISYALTACSNVHRLPQRNFGTGNSANLFYNILKQKEFWTQDTQKHFVDRDMS
jgi:UDP-N-acetylglucosamine 2-epimerase (hydrolysing)